MVAFHDRCADAVAVRPTEALVQEHSMRTVFAVTALALAITGPPFAAPQTPIGRFEGTVKGSLSSRPVSAAQVSLVRLESDPSINVSVRVDARGRFSVDSLPAGHYLVQVS